MNDFSATTSSPCRCAECPGAGCTCGCAAGHAAPAAPLQAAGACCACASRCGCDAAEQGCLCGTPAA
jgi:hypothetical protein